MTELFRIKPLDWEWRELAFSHAYITGPSLGFSALVIDYDAKAEFEKALDSLTLDTEDLK